MRTAAEIIAQCAGLDVNILVLRKCNAQAAFCLGEFVHVDPLAVREATISEYLQGPSKLAVCNPCMVLAEKLMNKKRPETDQPASTWQKAIDGLCQTYLKTSLISG